MERNFDFQKMAMMGIPEMHIDPTKNRWRYYVDTSYYGGMLDKSHEDFYRYVMLYPALAYFFFFSSGPVSRRTTRTISWPSGASPRRSERRRALSGLPDPHPPWRAKRCLCPRA